MKSFRDMLDIWKCNCYPAAAGLTVLLTAVGVAWNCERGRQVNLLLPALAVAMLVCGLFFSRGERYGKTGRFLALFLPLLVFSCLIGGFCVDYSEMPFTVNVEGRILQFGTSGRVYSDKARIVIRAVTLSVFFVAGLYGCLAGVAGRRIGKTTAVSIPAGVILFLFTGPLMAGISAALFLMLPSSRLDYMYIPYWSGFIPAIPALALWCVLLSGRGAKNSIRRALTDYGVMIAVSLLVFGAAYGMTVVRAWNALALAEKSGRKLSFAPPQDEEGAAAWRKLGRASADWIRYDDPERPRPEIPLESVYSWTNPDKNGISEEDKAFALAAIRTPEAAEFLAAVAELGKYPAFYSGEFDNIAHLSELNRVRSLMRKLCGIAAIHHYYGEHEQILPVLKLGLNISKAAAAGPPTTINGLVCIAVDSILADSIVSLGPDGPEHADDYREFLDYFNTDYSVPDDLELTADYLKRALERPEEMKYMFSDQKVPRLLRIFYISDLSGMVRERAEAQPQIGLLRNSAKLEYDGGGYVGEFVRALRKEKHRNGLFRTAVALKLYRSLHGAYPEHLDALVPGILPVLPADPVTGRPYEYRKDGDDFKLSYRVSPAGLESGIGSRAGY